MMDLDNSANDEWDERGSVVWNDIRYPDDAGEVLLSNEPVNDRDDLMEGGVSQKGFDEEIIDICDA